MDEPAGVVLDAERAARVLSDAAPSVFADMAFMDAVEVSVAWGPAADRAESAAGPVQRTRIAIDMLKPLSCRLELEFPPALGDRVNETLYGSSEDASGTAGDDSTLELLNVTAGAFLSGYFGPGAAFKLELPFFIFGASEVSGPAIARIEMDVEGMPVSLTLRSIRYRY